MPVEPEAWVETELPALEDLAALPQLEACSSKLRPLSKSLDAHSQIISAVPQVAAQAGWALGAVVRSGARVPQVIMAERRVREAPALVALALLG